MKLILKETETSAIEVSVGNFSARFEPGKAVEIENEKFAAYCLRQTKEITVGEEKQVVSLIEEAKEVSEAKPKAKK